MTPKSIIVALRVEANTRELTRRIEAYRSRCVDWRDPLTRARCISARSTARIMAEQREPDWRR